MNKNRGGCYYLIKYNRIDSAKEGEKHNISPIGKLYPVCVNAQTSIRTTQLKAKDLKYGLLHEIIKHV